MFQKYIHLERHGTDAVDGIIVGTCHIFPKLDGTNASFWSDDAGEFRCGSRNRELNIHEDNAGFMNWAIQQHNLKLLALDYPNYRFFGEWLVPHSLKTYTDGAWRKLYVFDVMMPNGEFMHYDEYSLMLMKYDVEFIPCVAKITNPTYEHLQKETERNVYLLKENSGHGEGIVIKQYGWKNRFGNTVWAKLIANSFKDQHIKVMGGTTLVVDMVEELIANTFITTHQVEKIISKIRTEEGLFSAKHIPRLLNTAYHELVTEELWQALKVHKNPKIDFKTLNHCTIRRVKQLIPELFGC